MNLSDVSVASLVTRILVVICLISFCEECPTGWFGTNCQYKCRCSNGTCDNEGLCYVNDVCIKGWFGPSCQYVDLAYNKSIVKEITDADDDTCITDLQQTIVSVQFGAIFTWLRLLIKYPKYRQDLQFFMKQQGLLKVFPNYSKSTFGDYFMDMHCFHAGVVEELIIIGSGARFLCSVYISGGRNLALKQSTSQSDTLFYGNESYGSDLAVDGNSNPHFLEGLSCSHTKVFSSVPSYWSVTLNHPTHVSRYVIYNRAEEDDKKLPDRLINFTLEAYNIDDVKVFSFTDSHPGPQAVYIIHSEAVDVDVKVVNIVPSRSLEMLTLTLCEVEVYGDFKCANKHYGLDCEKRCNCFNDQSCFVSTGACPSGCAVGYEGDNCSIRSSSETLNKQTDISRTKLMATVSSISLVLIMVTICLAALCRERHRDSEAEEYDSEEGDREEGDTQREHGYNRNDDDDDDGI